MTGLDATFDVAHPSRGQIGRNRRRWDELAADPRHLTGAITAVEQAVIDYQAAALLDDPVAVASAPILAAVAVDKVTPMLAAVRAELAEVQAHLQRAVHGMQAQERRADEGADVIRAMVWAFGDNDEARMERSVVAGISHLHAPCRDAGSIRAAAIASALEAAAYAVARRAELVVAS